MRLHVVRLRQERRYPPKTNQMSALLIVQVQVGKSHFDGVLQAESEGVLLERYLAVCLLQQIVGDTRRQMVHVMNPILPVSH